MPAKALAPGLDAAGVLGATFCARDGIADPNGVTMGFAKAAQAAGASIERGQEATAVSVSGGRVARVQTSRGTIETRVVVNAAGELVVLSPGGVELWRRQLSSPVTHLSCHELDGVPAGPQSIC